MLYTVDHFRSWKPINPARHVRYGMTLPGKFLAQRKPHFFDRPAHDRGYRQESTL